MPGILSLEELAARLRQLHLEFARRGETGSAAYRRLCALEVRFSQRDGSSHIDWRTVADARALLRKYGQL